MNRVILSFLTGCMMGVAVAYHYDDELQDTMHHAIRCQKKMMRRVHQYTK